MGEEAEVQWLGLGSLGAEPKVGILMQVIYYVNTLRRKGVMESG